MKGNSRWRSLMVGVGIEAVLVVLIQSAVVLLNLRPLPMHPVLVLGILTQLPGAILAIPLMLFESTLSEAAAGRLEIVEISVVVVAQSVFFATLHYNYAKHRLNKGLHDG